MTIQEFTDSHNEAIDFYVKDVNGYIEPVETSQTNNPWLKVAIVAGIAGIALMVLSRGKN